MFFSIGLEMRTVLQNLKGFIWKKTKDPKISPMWRGYLKKKKKKKNPKNSACSWLWIRDLARAGVFARRPRSLA